MKPIEVLSKFFEARDTVHFVHLNTTSYAKHKALGEFYDAWLDLADNFIETYQGRYVRITGKTEISISHDIDCEKYLSELRVFINQFCEEIITEKDYDLQNILADMLGLINHTLYLLTLS